MNRREFLSATSTAVAAAALTNVQTNTARASANDRIVLAVAGVRGRGGGLLNTFAALPDCEIKYVCDIDEKVLHERAAGVSPQRGKRPHAIKDYRRALDDPQVDALVLGTPDHWHALPTVHACQAGKDVYVEKPDGHNLIEGQTMVAAARKHGRIVQLGTQSRSGSYFLSGMEYLRAGNIGRPLFAKAWESTQQGSIGHPADSDPPEGVDYDFWLGPAPLRPFNPVRFHGHWRWFFDYGTGDLGNDGVHRLDVAKWGLETAIAAAGEEPLPSFPRSVSASGGKYYFDDAQEWPDTMMVTYDYPGRILTYEMRIWSRYPLHGVGEGAAVYGDGGYIVFGNDGWRAHGLRDEVVAQDSGERGDTAHAQNFLDCMRSRQKPVADLETVGHPASALCHLGNIAWRVGHTVRFDPESYTFPGDEEANRYLTRPEYRSPWTLPALSDV